MQMVRDTLLDYPTKRSGIHLDLIAMKKNHHYALSIAEKALAIKGLESKATKADDPIGAGFYPLKHAIKHLFPKHQPSQRTIRRMLADGEIPHIKVRGKIYVSLNDAILAFARQTINDNPNIKPKEMSKEETVQFLTRYTDITTDEAEKFAETIMEN